MKAVVEAVWNILKTFGLLLWAVVGLGYWAILWVIFRLLPAKPVDRMVRGLVGIGQWVSIGGRKALGLIGLLVGFIWAALVAAWGIIWHCLDNNDD